MTSREHITPRIRMREALPRANPQVTAAYEVIRDAREIRRPITTNDQLERLADY